MKTKKILSFCCAILFISSPAFANSNNTIVVTATRNQVRITEVPSQVNIITSKKLNQSGTTFVLNILKNIPGISVVSNGVFGGQTSISLRGLPTYYTKTLMDGVDISDPSQTRPYYNFANLLSSGVQRIEVVQGAQSGLYGSNAIGGVINIITPKGTGKPHFKYSQGFGSYNTLKEVGSFSGQYKQLSFYLEGTEFDTHGISKMDKYNPSSRSYSRGNEKDSYHQHQVVSRFELNLTNNLTIGTIFQWYKTRNYIDNGWYITPTYQYLPNDAAYSNNTPQAKSLRTIDHFLFSELYLKKILGRLKLNFKAFFVQNLRYYKSAPPYWYNFKGKRWGSNITAIYKTNSTKITVGGSEQIEKYEDTSPFKKLRYNYASFIEIQQRVSNLILQGVTREDDYETFGKHFTYKLGINYLIPQTNTILKANYGTGFRAPSIFELYAPSIQPWFKGGNKNLKPEKAKSWDFGIIQNVMENKISVNATYFKNIVRDRIAYYTNTATWQSTYKNVKGHTISYGYELGTKITPIKPLIIGANYTYTKSINPNTGKQTARIPLRVYTGYITLQTLKNRLISTIDGRYIGKRFDDPAHTHQTGKYAVFDFTILYKPTKTLEASLSIKNIFNRFYEEIYGYSTLPRSVFAKISYTF